jgi:hypothetical protein
MDTITGRGEGIRFLARPLSPAVAAAVEEGEGSVDAAPP